MNRGTQVSSHEPTEPYVEIAVETFSMLADTKRVRIMLALRDDERSVSHLTDIVDNSPESVFQHLAKLRLARIVATLQDGTRVFYRLTNEPPSRLVADALFRAEHALSSTPAHPHPRALSRQPLPARASTLTRPRARTN